MPIFFSIFFQNPLYDRNFSLICIIFSRESKKLSLNPEKCKKNDSRKSNNKVLIFGKICKEIAQPLMNFSHGSRSRTFLCQRRRAVHKWNLLHVEHMDVLCDNCIGHSDLFVRKSSKKSVLSENILQASIEVIEFHLSLKDTNSLELKCL